MFAAEFAVGILIVNAVAAAAVAAAATAGTVPRPPFLRVPTGMFRIKIKIKIYKIKIHK